MIISQSTLKGVFKLGLQVTFQISTLQKTMRIPHCSIKYNTHLTNGDAARRSKTHCDENGLGVF